jgi:hypothetical protein
MKKLDKLWSWQTILNIEFLNTKFSNIEILDIKFSNTKL